MGDDKINNLFLNLQLTGPYLSRGQKETIKDLRATYKLKGYLNSDQMDTLDKLWRVAIMSGGEVDKD